MDLKVSHLQLITDIVKLGSLTLAAKAQGWAGFDSESKLTKPTGILQRPTFCAYASRNGSN